VVKLSRTLPDGRKVKFTYQELSLDGTFMTAQLAGNEVVYSVVLTQARNTLSHEQVERHFHAELSLEEVGALIRYHSQKEVPDRVLHAHRSLSSERPSPSEF
jgi:hypothetical protein